MSALDDNDKVIHGAFMDSDAEMAALRNLWRAVVAQGVRDLTSMWIEDGVHVALDAARWLGSEDFIESCDHAGVDWKWLFREVELARAHPEPYRRYYLIELSRTLNVSMMGKTAGAGGKGSESE